MSGGTSVNIMFYDLDKGKEVDLDEKQILEANPNLSIQVLVENTQDVEGSLLNLEDGVKRIVETIIEFEDDYKKERKIIFKFQDKEKTIYK